MKNIQRVTAILAIALAAMSLQGCLTSVVTAPVKIVYGAGKLAVKGTAAAVRAVVPDGDDKEKQDQQADRKEQQPEQPQQQQTTP
ncbi:MAG: NF038104 family lipoprotein [Xanthomonadales bacterium]|nr:NF038104 family lipoprotein [Xanthomonadales bacterium]